MGILQRWSGVVALFLVLAGGGAWAATELSKDSVRAKHIKKNAVRSKHIKNGQVKKKDIRKNAINTKKVKDRSLRAIDFAEGELPAGPQGPQGPQGSQGPPGSGDNVRVWTGTSTGGTVTIDISSAGYSGAVQCVASAVGDAASAVTAPFASIKTCTPTSVVVNVLESNEGPILIGAAYQGLTFAPDGTTVHLITAEEPTSS